MSVDVDWGDRDDGPMQVPANFAVNVQGVALNPPPDGATTGMWTSTSPVTTGAASGANSIIVSYDWRDRNASHVWRGTACGVAGNTPCQQSGAGPAHHTFSGDDSNAGIVDLVRNADSAQLPAGSVGSPLDNIALSATDPTTITVFPTIGLRDPLKPGDFLVIRPSDAQGSTSLNCDPLSGQGQEFQTFVNGCQPFYGPNTFTQGFWWDLATQQCPSREAIVSQPNSSALYWQCVPTAPGFSPGVIADGIAARTGNCAIILSNGCGAVVCNNPNRWSEYPNLDPSDPRLVRVFIVPYGASKGINGNDGLPVTHVASVYITGWGGNGADADPCPADDPAQPGQIVGHFVSP